MNQLWRQSESGPKKDNWNQKVSKAAFYKNETTECRADKNYAT